MRYGYCPEWTPASRTPLVDGSEGSDGVGELLVRAAQICQPDPDGWLHTGDLGRRDEEGFLFLHGRKGDKIIGGGGSILPLEVERALELHGSRSEVGSLS